MITKKISLLIATVIALPLAAQTFKSGSTGADGDLTFPNAKSGDTVIFDPNDKTLFPKGVDPAHDNVFNFGKITIPAGVHVILSADKLGGPVYFLANGDVQVNANGWLDLDGKPGAAQGYNAQTFAVPVPGGFYGGRRRCW